mmetsp:Transcript_19673/g.45883  ORF Transcript_19673/g.45883 Transcript_19673/m.45883 type:complete len:229 (-) Transcript_19673:43-729(-)
MTTLFCCCTSCDERKQDMILPETAKMGVSSKDLRRPISAAMVARDEVIEQQVGNQMLSPPLVSHDEHASARAAFSGTEVRSEAAVQEPYNAAAPPAPEPAPAPSAPSHAPAAYEAKEPSAAPAPELPLKEAPSVTPSRPPTMEVRIRKEGGRTLGIVLSGSTRDPTRAMIKVIRDDGLIAEWNRGHGPDLQITTGTEVLNVNGRTDSQEMLKAVKEEVELVMIMTTPK